jgi:hypothetical protein
MTVDVDIHTARYLNRSCVRAMTEGQLGECETVRSLDGLVGFGEKVHGWGLGVHALLACLTCTTRILAIEVCGLKFDHLVPVPQNQLEDKIK